GRQEQSVVLAGQAGGEALEFVDGRIITPPRVAEARLHDGRHHLGGRQRDRVASEIVDRTRQHWHLTYRILTFQLNFNAAQRQVAFHETACGDGGRGWRARPR